MTIRDIGVEVTQVLALLVRHPGVGDERRQVLLAQELCPACPFGERLDRRLGDARVRAPRPRLAGEHADEKKDRGKRAGPSQLATAVPEQTA